VPGDRIELETELEARLESAARVVATAGVEGRKVARAELTFVLREVDSTRVHEQRREIYRVWTRDLTPQPVIP
jgi:3-hydroxyacyl-[acyl-carrier-protein] dehydratase